MLSSINPLGERAKGNRFWVTAMAYVLGATVGGVALGVLAGVVGLVPRLVADDRIALALVGVAAVVGLAFDLAGRRRGSGVPSWHRQVDEAWLDEYRGTVYGFGFGLQLGFGVVTIITSAITWVVVAAAALQPTFAASVAIGAIFGVSRGLGIVAVARVDDVNALRDHLRSFASREPDARRLTVSALASAGVLALGGAWLA